MSNKYNYTGDVFMVKNPLTTEESVERGVASLFKDAEGSLWYFTPEELVPVEEDYTSDEDVYYRYTGDKYKDLASEKLLLISKDDPRFWLFELEDGFSWSIPVEDVVPWVENESENNTQSLGVKYDQEKTDWSLIPFDALEEVVRVLEYGKKKYTRTLEDGTIISGADNWKLVDNSNLRYWKAAMRHMIAHKEGEVYDPETGNQTLHLAHAVCSLLFEIWKLKQEKR